MGAAGLGHRQIYVLPTRHGFLFGLLVVVLLLAAINYGNGLAYGLAFLLAALGLVSIPHTQRNLLRLVLTPGVAEPVFAGDTAAFELCLSNPTGWDRWGVVVMQETGPTRPWRGAERRPLARLELAAGASRCVQLTLPAPRRGRLAAPAYSLATLYPLGLFRAWSRRLESNQTCLVYPCPAPPGLAPRLGGGPSDHGAGANPRGGDDFTGLRDYRAGDSPRHVHWKAVARGQGWFTKEFGGGDLAGGAWLDWEDLAGQETEARLSILTRWVIDAERDGVCYGLRLPGTQIPPGHGEAHQRGCLAALALFQP